MSGGIDLFSSRRTNFDLCKYWLKKEYSDDEMEYYAKELESLDYENENNEDGDGIFYARLAGGIRDAKNVVGGAIMLSSQTLNIVTSDDVSELKANDRVEFRGKTYLVVDIQASPIRKNNEFSDDVACNYYISLRG